MKVFPNNAGNVTSVVPFLNVPDVARSVDFYLNGLGFTMTRKWIDDGRLRWCWLEKGAAALMIQELWKDGSRVLQPAEQLGQGVSLVFICDDAPAVYRDITARGIQATEPCVGNGMWNFGVSDPYGFRLEFESLTDTPEDTRLSDL